MLSQLAKVLESRGFLITLNEDYIYFSKGNEKGELKYLKEMFNELRNIWGLADGYIKAPV